MRNRTGIQTAPPGPAGSCPPPAAHNQPDDCHGHDGHPDDDGEAGAGCLHRPAGRCRPAAVQPAAGHPRAAPAPPAPQVTSTPRRVPGPTSRDQACPTEITTGDRLVPGDLDRGRVKRAARPPARGVPSVTDIKVLITARLRLMSRPAHTAAAFSAATSGASTFSRAALSSSAPIASRRAVARPSRLEHLSAAHPAQGTIPGHLLQVRADRRRFLPQPRHVNPGLLHAHQIGGIGARDNLATTSFSMNVSTGSACPATCPP